MIRSEYKNFLHISKWILFVLIANCFADKSTWDTGENEFYHVFIVDDTDGFVNVRSSPGANSNVVGCIASGTPIHSDDILMGDTKWWQIHSQLKQYQKSCTDSSQVIMEAAYSDSDQTKAYIHSSRLTRLSSLDTLRRHSVKKTKNKIVSVFDSFEITLDIRKFTPKGKAIKKGGFGETIIDERFAWGTDGTIPAMETANLAIRHSDFKIEVDKSLFTNLYDLHPNPALIFKGRNGCYHVALQGGDGAASYFVVLTIRNNKIIRLSPRISFFA